MSSPTPQGAAPPPGEELQPAQGHPGVRIHGSGGLCDLAQGGLCCWPAGQQTVRSGPSVKLEDPHLQKRCLQLGELTAGQEQALLVTHAAHEACVQ